MEDLTTLKSAHIILEAVRLTLDAEITSLRQLTAANSQVLKLELTLRILLTFLPESTDVALYIDFLRDVSTLPPTQTSEFTLLLEPNTSDKEALAQVRRLHLQPLAYPRYAYLNCDDPLTLFILHRAHQIDAETGSLPIILQLVAPFINRSECLQNWAISVFLPLLRLGYEYYPDDGPTYSLEAFEALDGNPTIDILLSETVQRKREISVSSLARDLRGLIGPWLYGEGMRKRRKLHNGQTWTETTQPSSSLVTSKDQGVNDASSGWAHVNEWLLDLAFRDFPRAVEIVEHWDGPRDVDYGDWIPRTQQTEKDFLRIMTINYAQAALATIYATKDCSAETSENSFRILQKVAKLMHLQAPPDLNVRNAKSWNFLPEFLDGLSQSNLLHNSLLRPSNPFTTPVEASIQLCYLIISSNFLLQTFAFKITFRSLLELSVFGSATDQVLELRKILYNLQGKQKDRDDWNQIRINLLRLRNWKYEGSDHTVKTQRHPLGVFCRVESDEFESEILKTLLNASCCDLAVETYCKKRLNPIPLSKVEDTVLSTALACYDGASNGNRTRGGVRKASEIILAFRNYFPESLAFRQTLALISATHAMSFYSLTLQHGVPFQPVNIRAHKDPISLVGKILGQNIHSYTKLDDLLEIGSNLVSAGITQSPHNWNTNQLDKAKLDQELSTVTRRITAMAIESALAEEDFDTAYSYVVNRLSPPDISYSSGSEVLNNSLVDVSWQAAYQAGRHTTNSNGPSALRRLEQRMELLSQALLLAPPSALSEILAVWRQCEESMTTQMVQEIEEEEKWDDSGDRRIPGGFSLDSSPVIQKAREPSRNAMSEEAPMGLFDVARGAAAALSKNAFPLRTSRNSGSATPIKASHERMTSTGGSDGGSLSGVDSEGRVRKRDIVSNMVTGGLASGIGWVIGAPAPRQE